MWIQKVVKCIYYFVKIIGTKTNVKIIRLLHRIKSYYGSWYQWDTKSKCSTI